MNDIGIIDLLEENADLQAIIRDLQIKLNKAEQDLRQLQQGRVYED